MLRAILHLVERSVPFDVAFCLDWPTVLAWNVIFDERSSGKQYNWSTMSWPSD